MLRIRTVLICFLCLASILSHAQTQKAAPPAQSTADTNTDNSEEPDDRDSFVRAAAARQLGDYRGKQVTDALQGAFDDPKPVVRLMAAASYLRASQPETARPKPSHRKGEASKNSFK